MNAAARLLGLDATPRRAAARAEGPVLVQGRRAELPAQDTELELGLSWLLKVRWGAVAGQLLALAFVRFVLELDLPYLPLLGFVAFTAASNAALTFRGRPVADRWTLPVVLAVDVIVLTLMLATSGGASNPFTVFFLVHVALAALLLEARLAWAIVSLTTVAFATLFFLPATVPANDPTHHHHDHAAWSAHLVGMWVAYVLAAGFVAHFVGRVSRAIRERDRRLAEVAHLAAQNERLATLSSFSANAAHELGSPLATIGLASKELAIALRREAPDSALTADAELVCREVARCREILAALSARAGESVGEMPVRTTPGGIVEELLRRTAPKLAAHVRVRYVDAASEHAAIVAPKKTIAQLLHNLIRNAFDAHEEAEVDTPVELYVEAGEQLRFLVRDRGKGLSPEVRAKIGEPFVTTKAGRGGLGLGVYLARAYAERTGGALTFRARAEGGTEVELCLARDALLAHEALGGSP
ncbi:MAG TPA: HAMP domain-containing sensor histidine kinase [Polyangiaceae bacterium]|nr:HAMP domain-containing sensor histidine kinase [Polyangiaceae bacterium]